MSLINKMLQDLDARGTPAAESFTSQIRPVARERAGLAGRFELRGLPIAIACACAAVAILLLLWFAWAHYRKAGGAEQPAAVVTAAKKAAPASKPTQGMSSTITVGPAAAPVPAPAAPLPAADTPAPAPVAASAPAVVPVTDNFDAPKSVAGYEPDSGEARAARQAIMAELQSRMAPARVKPAVRPHESKHESKHEAKRRKQTEERALKAAKHARTAAGPGAGAGKDGATAAVKGKRSVHAQGRQESGSQRAEGAYRHALDALQDGRMTEALAALEQALRLDPAHDAARQTLVGLLIEAKRTDEAMRHLQAALALDPRQPALAMLLARLQIEGGGAGIDTLTRTLPYAGNNADYHAFLAGALQRQQRNREAAEQYQAALRTAPGNGVWWMGLGMSLQAEKRNAEALDAFRRARASGTLSAELLAFVERRLQQLGR